jgi:molybdenum cofactor biosynthesis protein B
MPGGRVDPERAFTRLNLAVMTISDSHDASTDSSGDLLAERIAAAGHELKARAIVGFDKARIQAQARAWIDDPGIDAIVSNGGTGLKPHEV